MKVFKLTVKKFYQQEWYELVQHLDKPKKASDRLALTLLKKLAWKGSGDIPFPVVSAIPSIYSDITKVALVYLSFT